jgi:hypothetical protein
LISTLINEVLNLEDACQIDDDGNVVIPLTTLLRLVELAQGCRDSLEVELLPGILARGVK